MTFIIKAKYWKLCKVSSWETKLWSLKNAERKYQSSSQQSSIKMRIKRFNDRASVVVCIWCVIRVIQRNGLMDKIICLLNCHKCRSFIFCCSILWPSFVVAVFSLVIFVVRPSNERTFSNQKQFYVSIYRFAVIFWRMWRKKNDIENVNVNHRKNNCFLYRTVETIIMVTISSLKPINFA